MITCTYIFYSVLKDKLNGALIGHSILQSDLPKSGTQVGQKLLCSNDGWFVPAIIVDASES